MSAVPTPYTPSFSFYDWNVNNPNIPAPGQKWDTEYNNIKTLFDAMLARAALIQRDDGFLKNGVVTRDSLSTGIAYGFNAPTAWTINHDYGATDSVSYNGSLYWSKVAHNSGGTFDGSKWQFVATFASADPTAYAIGKESLVDGILSADTAGRAKMADGYVTKAKMDPSASAGLAKAWCKFRGGVTVSSIATMTFVGSTITATFSGNVSTGTLGDDGMTVGSTINFFSQTGNNAILNGSWRVLSFNGSTGITFQISGTPAGVLSGTANSAFLAVGASFNIKTIWRLGTGQFFVQFLNPMTDGNYVLVGSAQVAGGTIPSTVVALDSDYGTTTSGCIVRVAYIPDGAPAGGFINAGFGWGNIAFLGN